MASNNARAPKTGVSTLIPRASAAYGTTTVPASTSSGPSVASTASRCAGFRPATMAAVSGAGRRAAGAAVLVEDRAKERLLYQEFSVGKPAATQADVPPTTL